MSGILIAPKDFDYSPKLPSFGGNISPQETQFPSNEISSPKVMFFIGGFGDRLTKALFYCFSSFQHQEFCKFYATFDAVSHLDCIIPLLKEKQIYIIAHSWGACNTIKMLAKFNFPITYLLTLDDVSYSKPKPLPSVEFWENVYITDHFYFDRSNIVALIGHPQGAIAFANLNLGIHPPYTHASTSAMLSHSQLYKNLYPKLQDF